eukprot:CAMPEP_0115843966 /NCGR_PEP_ID=MMETSP0287-20121206/8587_1 /TAXON_ID=412157 /ORGANISM="Chrysochromulina rotalis, Strain UIO044" /LENGTH=99 /DNA_ID=CAMNT_0003297681 /DNA_START=82 /DNA_END=382 /DNA_ORIENTATION=+
MADLIDGTHRRRHVSPARLPQQIADSPESTPRGSVIRAHPTNPSLLSTASIAHVNSAIKAASTSAPNPARKPLMRSDLTSFHVKEQSAIRCAISPDGYE